MNWTQAEQDAAAKWSGFRQWISKNPLSGFWAGVAGGAAVMFVLNVIL